ncbi:MAG: response regulator, partial [Clostridia bacterium]|nr:response regulator [Clostridia bacterium]
GYIVHHVFTGEEALRAITDDSLQIDLILMDIDLGSGIDGTEAAEKILAHQDIPIVFLSSHTEPEVVEKTEKITSYGYVVKNTGTVVLDASIKMALKLFESKQERISAEKGLMEREETFYILFEGSVRPLLLMKDGLFIECNKAALTFLGITDKERFIGSSPIEISPERQPDGRLSSEAAPEFLKKAHNEGFCQFEWMCQRYDGTPFLLEVTLLQITRQGEKLLHVTWYDITERKKAEEEIQKQLSEKEILLKEIHHRIKNSINNIESLITLQADSNTNPDVKAALMDGVSRIHSIYVLYERLLIGEEYLNVSIQTYVESLLDSIVEIYKNNNIKIIRNI